MIAFLAKFLVRILTYFFGSMLVLALVGIGGFFIARPQIDDFIITEIKKRGLEVESWDLAFNGRANLHAARMMLPGGIEVKAALISARPPIAGFAGSATFYDLRIDRGEMSLVIPELDVSGISERESGTAAASKTLKLLQRFDIDKIFADGAFLTIAAEGTDSNSAAVKLGGFMLEDVRGGNIKHLRFEGLDSQLDKINQQAGEGNLRVGALDMRDIDMETAFNIFIGKANNRDQSIVPIFGDVRLDDVSFEGRIGAKPFSVSLGNLTSAGLSLKLTEEIVPLDLLRHFLMVQRGEVSNEEKKHTQENLRQLLKIFNDIDVDLSNVELGIPTSTVKFQSLIFRADDWDSIIPEKIDLKLEGLVLDITGQSEDITQLLDLTGYNRIEASASMIVQLDKGRKNLTLEGLSFNAQNIGDFFMAFQLDNVDMHPLMEEGEDVKDWLQKLRLRDFNMGMRDRGAVANFVTIIAGIGGVEGKEISQDLEDIARQTPSILFEDEALAASAEEALLAFLRQSGLLMFHITSKAGDGLELKQIIGDEIDWQSLLAMAEIRISHEKDSSEPG